MAAESILLERISKLDESIMSVSRRSPFKRELKELRITIKRIISTGDEITNLNRELGLPEPDSELCTSIINEAEGVVNNCLKIKWNPFKLYAHSLKLNDVNEKLLRVFLLEDQKDRSWHVKEILLKLKDVKQGVDGLASYMENLGPTTRELLEGNEVEELGLPELSEEIEEFKELIARLKAKVLSESPALSKDSYKESETSSSLQGSQQCRRFELPEIQQATKDFDESLVIGHGGFGKVYKGNIVSGSDLVIVAIKRLDFMSSQGATEFWAEIEILSGLRHCNLVSLIGYCNHGREKILVYEYMSNGTLENHLNRHGTPLSWVRRLEICIGAGRGLHYLHTGTGIEVGVTHRDVKTSNILLHENWAAKISDFGLSKTGPTDQPSTYVKTQVRGTFGYLDPDYSYTGKLTRKSDVYAFGVVLFEVLCGRPALDHGLDDEKQNLARWAQESIKEGNLRCIIDSDIRGQISPQSLKQFVVIATRCLHNNPKERPTMADVVGSLESILRLQVKWKNPLETGAGTLLGRVREMFTFLCKGKNSGNSSSY